MFKKLFLIVTFSFLVACVNSERRFTAATAPVTAPKLIQVYNGTSFGYYTSSGNYGFTTQARSVFSAVYGSSPQILTDSLNGITFVGSSCTIAGCHGVTFFENYRGGYKFTSEANSRFYVNSPGSARGLAFDINLNRLFVANATDKKVTFLTASTGAYALGNISSSTFDLVALETATSVQYLAADNQNSRLLITDPTLGYVYFLNSNDGSVIATSPDPLIANTNCGSGTLGYAISNSTLHQIYILCDQAAATDKVVVISTSGTPSLAFTWTLSYSGNSIATASDIVINTRDNSIVATGNTQVVRLDGTTGGGLASVDLVACDATMTLSAITYDHTNNIIYVADSTNSNVYRLNGTTLAMVDPLSCANSRFSTLADLSTPTRLSFF